MFGAVCPRPSVNTASSPLTKNKLLPALPALTVYMHEQYYNVACIHQPLTREGVESMTFNDKYMLTNKGY
jgi:hypothetical protein